MIVIGAAWRRRSQRRVPWQGSAHDGPPLRVVVVIARKGRVLGLVRRVRAHADHRVSRPLRTPPDPTFSVKMPALRRRAGDVSRGRGDAVSRGCGRSSATTSREHGGCSGWTSGTSSRACLFAVVPAVVAIGVLVGGIVIMNIMLMRSPRTHEIGIRKSMGATASDVRRQFLIESIALSLLGGVLGVLSDGCCRDRSLVSPRGRASPCWSWRWRCRSRRHRSALRRVSGIARAALDPITAMRAET